MFDLHEMYKTLIELSKEEDRPQVIPIRVYLVKDKDLYESEEPDKKDEFDDQTIDDWYDFTGTIEGIIENFCEKVNISTSNYPGSLSEYIDFYCYDQDGNKKNYLIDLRLSDHKQTDNAKRIRKKRVKKINSNYYLESITIKDKTFESYRDAIFYLRKILAAELVKDRDESKKNIIYNFNIL